MISDPQTTLHEMREKLLDYRVELETAQQRGQVHVAAIAERVIRIEHILIRAHCWKWKLAVPEDVPNEA